MQILVADDDPVYRSLLKDLLTQWHFDVVLACNGLEAWEVMQRDDAPRLAIIDWMMPEMDGFELARAIRDKESDNHTYTILITGSRKKDEVMKVLVCGADDYLIKPFDPMDLKIHLRIASRFIHLQEELNDLKKTHRQATGVR